MKFGRITLQGDAFHGAHLDRKLIDFDARENSGQPQIAPEIQALVL